MTAINRVEEEEPEYILEFYVFSDGFEDVSDTGVGATPASNATNGAASAAPAVRDLCPGPSSDGGPGSISRSCSGRAAATTTPTTTTAGPPPHEPPSSFPRFGDLPAELRLRVWEELIQPRIVMVTCCAADPSHPSRAAKLAQLGRRPAPRPRVPVLLHACRESRALGLRHYEPAFSWRAPLTTAVPSPSPPPPSPLPSSSPSRQRQRRRRRPAAVYFNFALDALYLLGELDREDPYGFVGSPLPYYLDRADAARVRHVAVAFEELRVPEGHERLFSGLYPVVDRFAAAERLLVACTDRDFEEEEEEEEDRAYEGGFGAGGWGGGGWEGPKRRGMRSRSRWQLPLPGEDNIVQKIWRGWLAGTSVVSSTLMDKKIIMVREAELQSFIRAHL